MHKKIAGLILRPRLVPSTECRRGRLRFRAVQHRRDSRPLPMPLARAGRQEAEDLFCQLADDWLYITHVRKHGDYPGDGLSFDTAWSTFLATASNLWQRLPLLTDYRLLAVEAEHYQAAQFEWVERSAYPLVIAQGGTFKRNPPPRRLHALDRPGLRTALSLLQNAGAHRRV